MIVITDHGNSVKQCLAIIETMTIEHVNVEHVALSKYLGTNATVNFSR